MDFFSLVCNIFSFFTGFSMICSSTDIWCENKVIKVQIDYDAIIMENKSYVDNSFPANISSLIGKNNIALHLNLKNEIYLFDEVLWKRPSDIFWRDYRLFSTIEPNIFEQGAIGDCYFIASLSSLSKYPNHIKRLFKQNMTNIAGVYVIILYDEKVSSWREIIIDDFLPVKEGILMYDFAFIKTKDRSIWPHLIEKAYAKLRGSYFDIHGGYPAAALKALTGAKVTSHIHSSLFHDSNINYQKLNEFFIELKKSIDNGFILCVSSYPGNYYDNLYNGVIPSHSYSIIDVLYFFDDDNNPVKLIKLRNPHGYNEWQGEWSDISNKWTSNRIKIEARFHGVENDGIFFMMLEDYLIYFKITDICEYKEK